MIVVCPSCSARFQYDETRFQGAVSKRFRCPKCSHVFEVFNPIRPAADTDSESLLDPDLFGAPPPVPPPYVEIQRTQAFVPTQVEPMEHSLSSSPMPIFQTVPEEDMPPAAPGEATAQSTARRDRQAMLQNLATGQTMLPPGIKFSLAFLTGPMASTVRVLDRPNLVIGRDQGEIITHDPETSRRHASLDIHADGTAWLTDLQSTNGTFVDGAPIQGTVQMADRQEFTCGKSTFMLLIRPDDQFSLD